MPISVDCDCGKSYKLADDKAGMKLRCKDCGAIIKVPSGDEDEFGLDDFDEEPVAKPKAKAGAIPARSGANKKPAKSAKKKSSEDGNGQKAALGGGIGTLLLIVGWVAFRLFVGRGNDDDDDEPVVAQNAPVPVAMAPANAFNAGPGALPNPGAIANPHVGMEANPNPGAMNQPGAFNPPGAIAPPGMNPNAGGRVFPGPGGIPRPQISTRVDGNPGFAGRGPMTSPPGMAGGPRPFGGPPSPLGMLSGLPMGNDLKIPAIQGTVVSAPPRSFGKANVLNMAYIPDDAFVSIILRPSKFLNTPLVKNNLPEDATKKLDEIAAQKGFDFRKIDYLAFTIARPATEVSKETATSIATVTLRFSGTKDPTLAAKLFADGQTPAEATAPNGKKYWKATQSPRASGSSPFGGFPLPGVGGSGPTATPATPTTSTNAPPVIFAAYGDPDGTFVVGTEESVLKLLSASNSTSRTSYKSRLSTLEIDGDLTVFGTFDRWQDLIQAIKVPEANGAQASSPLGNVQGTLIDVLKNLHSVSVSIDLSGDNLLRVFAETKNPAAAGKLNTLAQTAVGFAGIPLQQQAAQLRRRPGQEAMAKVLTNLATGMNASSKGNDVFLTVKNPGGLEEVARSMVAAQSQAAQMRMGMPGVSPPGLGPLPQVVDRQGRNNFKQIGLAMHNFHDTYKVFPYAAGLDAQGRPLLSWRVYLLPFIEQAPLYAQFKLNEPWDSPNNKPLIAKMPTTYAATGTKVEEGKTRLLLVTGPLTAYGGNSPPPLSSFRDGTSNTLLVVEAGADKAVEWTKPEDFVLNGANPLAGLGEIANAGFTALFCDGSVTTIPKTIPASAFRALCTNTGGEIIDRASWFGTASSSGAIPPAGPQPAGAPRIPMFSPPEGM